MYYICTMYTYVLCIDTYVYIEYNYIFNFNTTSIKDEYYEYLIKLVFSPFFLSFFILNRDVSLDIRDHDPLLLKLFICYLK